MDGLFSDLQQAHIQVEGQRLQDNVRQQQAIVKLTATITSVDKASKARLDAQKPTQGQSSSAR